jgi:hypothetical protein
MLRTTTEQSYQLDGSVKSAVLFCNVSDVFFRLQDKVCICYVQKGYVSSELDPISNETVERENVLANMPVTFTDAELKTALDAAGYTVNADTNNLILSDFEAGAKAILLDMISTDNSKFFGVSVDNWA